MVTETQASMGPHVFACGNPRCCRMNVDTFKLQWGRTFLRAEMLTSKQHTRRPIRLQWGRTFLRAEISVFADFSRHFVPLQWGRTFLRAEINSEGKTITGRRVASMGPHVFACGNREGG